nr:MAG TPA: hypothetical protein [Caudoviricetes sp.]
MYNNRSSYKILFSFNRLSPLFFFIFGYFYLNFK